MSLTNRMYSPKAVMTGNTTRIDSQLPPIPIPTSHARSSDVHVIRTGDVISEVHIMCTCGETHSIRCEY